MVRRLAFAHVVAMHIIVVCTSSFADTPLVIAELEAKRTIAQADSAGANAEQALALWKLAQLKTLQSHGHAAWQEVAEQEVALTSAAARAKAAEQFVQTLLHWQTRVAKLDLSQAPAESESVRLYMPRSARLVAWLSTDVASLELSKQHLENLGREYQSALEIDVPPLEREIKAAQQAVEIYGRGDSEHLLRRAEIRLRSATADYESAKARRLSAGIVARRMTLVRESLPENQSETQMEGLARSPALAQLGTRLVDATSNHDLTRLVKAMAGDETIAIEQIAWLERRRDAALARIDALQILTEHAHADRHELDHAKQQHIDLELQIQQAQQSLQVQRRIADRYERTLDSPSTANIEPPESVLDDIAFQADANTVRHWLELQQLELDAVASRAATEAQRDYLVERLNRVGRIPEQARPPKELEQLRDKIQGVEQQLVTVGRELVALRREQQRFCRQVQSQRGDQYQLVQAEKGEFIRRQQFEMLEALIAAVAFVGPTGLFPELPSTYPYIESTILLDCMQELRIERPGLSVGLLSRPGWGNDGTIKRRVVDSSIWNAPNNSSELQRGTDGIRDPSNLFCYTPYGLRRIDSGYRWASYHYSPRANTNRFRSYYPFGGGDRNACGAIGCAQSVLSYRFGCPSRDSFPYRSSYLYQTAFPTRSNLYSNVYARPSSPFSGLGYTSWLSSSCFD